MTLKTGSASRSAGAVSQRGRALSDHVRKASGPDPKNVILGALGSYAYNAMELCRILNGRGPRDFQGCYYKFDLNRRGPRCRMKERGCQGRSNAVDQLLRRLQRKGLVHSVKMRWFDGRSKGAASNSLQLDVFRFYFLHRRGLACRLQDDIRKHLLGGEIA